MRTWDSDKFKLCTALLFVLAIRLPFLNQPIQGDDVYYLYGAQHAQIEPLHPKHTEFVFAGNVVDMRGHSHGPLNSWTLGALLATFGDVHEVPFHLAYVAFSMLAAWAMYSLASRFCDRPLLATLLFIVVPPFVISGTSLEADLPFVAFWMASVALFIRGVDQGSRWALAASAIAAAAASLTAYQAVVLTPILAVYLWLKADRTQAIRIWTWIAIAAAPLAITSWQLWERWSSGALPAAMLAGYLQPYEIYVQKIRSAVALVVHTGWIVSPLIIAAEFWRRRLGLLPAAIAIAAGAFYDRDPLFLLSLASGTLVLTLAVKYAISRDFLGWWIAIFFAGAVIIFFAGSARYLLPMAAPVVILAVRSSPASMLWIGLVVHLALSLSLAAANYQHWDGYRQFAQSLNKEASSQRVWVNGEWTLRYYLESEGALPLTKTQPLAPKDIIVTSELSASVHPMSPVAPLRQQILAPWIPLRLISLTGLSAYSSSARGFLPFEISREPADRIHVDTVLERNVELPYIDPRRPEGRQQVLSGLYEDGWMSAEASVILKPPAKPRAVQVQVYIPPDAPARKVELWIEDRKIAEDIFPKPGAYSLSAPFFDTALTAIATIKVDRTHRVPGDQRDLGVVVTGVGFR